MIAGAAAALGPAGGPMSAGYLRTIPPPGKPRLQRAPDAEPTPWVSLWCGEGLRLDRVRSDQRHPWSRNDHIVLAVGGGIFPMFRRVDGIIVGSRKQKPRGGSGCAAWWNDAAILRETLHDVIILGAGAAGPDVRRPSPASAD